MIAEACLEYWWLRWSRNLLFSVNSPLHLLVEDSCLVDKSEHHDLPWSRDCELKISWRLIRLVGNEPSTRVLNGKRTGWNRSCVEICSLHKQNIYSTWMFLTSSFHRIDDHIRSVRGSAWQEGIRGRFGLEITHPQTQHHGHQFLVHLRILPP